jgi:hypothetical protein
MTKPSLKWTHVVAYGLELHVVTISGASPNVVGVKLPTAIVEVAYVWP